MESPFARFTTDTVSLKGGTVTIQKLSGRALEVAQAASARALVSGRGYAERLSRLLKSSEAEAQAFVADPLNGYDITEVNAAGIVSWTFEQPVSRQNVEDLDDESSDVLARAILKLTKPQLFEAPEAVRKNG